MNINIRHLTAALLILSCGLLAVLVPGGPIETRSFSQINPLILTAFNIFLTGLVVISILLVYLMLKNITWAFVLSGLCGLSYSIVYILDLGKIFPTSPDSMPPALLTIEILGAIVSVPLMLVSLRGAIAIDHPQAPTTVSQASWQNFSYIAVSLVILGIGIIIFATKSAISN